MSKSETRAIAREFKTHVLILGSIVALMWGIEIVDHILGGALDIYGIVPRRIFGLRGILFAPLLHGHFPHLIGNTLPFIILGWLIMLRRTSDFFVATAVAMLVGGLGTWLIGSPGTHIGASGVIFGYLGFLLSRGYFERSATALLFSIVVGLLYGGLLFGVLPGQVGISWEGHLFGFIGGVIAARLVSSDRDRKS